ncbi:MAG TPA: NIPSNAP family protein [Candidatus Eisenbacteria bacterium]|nr:NIPSNAP family protein [Candidatus Eisenbacteria bacterium]
MKRLVEIRSYNLKPGHREAFHRLVVEKSLPLLKKWRVDVIDFGPSPHDDNSYYLIRAYRDLVDRQASQDAFYGSSDWRQGPRDEILPLIDTHTSIVLEIDATTLDALRKIR